MKSILFYMLIACTACKSSSSVEYDDVYTKNSSSSNNTKKPSSSSKDRKKDGWTAFDSKEHILWTKASDAELRSLYLATHSEIRLSCEGIVRETTVNKSISRKENSKPTFLKIPAGTIGKVLDIKYDRYGASEFYLFFDKQDKIYKLWFKRASDNLFYLKHSSMRVDNLTWIISVTDYSQAYLDVWDRLEINTETEEGVASGGY